MSAMRLLLFVFLLCAPFTAPLAQPAGALQSEDGEILVPTVPYNEEEARLVALERIHGEIIATERYKNEDDFFYEFTIQSAEGMVFEIDINADTGEIYDIAVKTFIPGAPLPLQVFDQKIAAALARSYIREETLGVGRTSITRQDIGVFEDKLVYIIEVKKSGRKHNVIIDAIKGDLLKSREQ